MHQAGAITKAIVLYLVVSPCAGVGITGIQIRIGQLKDSKTAECIISCQTSIPSASKKTHEAFHKICTDQYMVHSEATTT